MFDVRRAYFQAEEKRDTFVDLPDYVPAEFRAMHVGKLRKALYGTRPAAASWVSWLTTSALNQSGQVKRIENNLITEALLQRA